MKRARVIGSVALAAGLAALPAAAMATTHHVAQRAIYSASGVAAGAATCATPESVTINHTAYHPTGLGTNGTPLAVQINGATRFVGAHGKVLSCASIKPNDRLVAYWNEPHGTAFSPTAPATRIVDLGPRLEHFWIQGVASAKAVCTHARERDRHPHPLPPEGDRCERHDDRRHPRRGDQVCRPPRSRPRLRRDQVA